jgi:hypothetical protein
MVAMRVRDITNTLKSENHNIRAKLTSSSSSDRKRLRKESGCSREDSHSHLAEAEKNLQLCASELLSVFDKIRGGIDVAVVAMKLEEENLDEEQKYAKYNPKEANRLRLDRPDEFQKERDQIISALVGLENYVTQMEISERIAKRLRDEFVKSRDLKKLLKKLRQKPEHKEDNSWIIWTVASILSVVVLTSSIFWLVKKEIVTITKIKRIFKLVKQFLYSQVSLF